MPWNHPRLPKDAAYRPDLAPFVDRAAEVWDGDEFAGLVYVEADWFSELLRGHLWWRRWGRPREFVTLYLRRQDGTFDQWRITDLDEVDASILDLNRERLTIDGRRHRITWLTPTASASVAAEFRLVSDRGLSWRARQMRPGR